MSLVVSLIVAILLVAIFHKPLKFVPWLFYVFAIALCAVSIYLTFSPAPSQILRSIVFAIQKGQIGFSLFAIVMFVGVFDRNSAIRRTLTPIRAEVSILATILILGHLIPYAINYLSVFTHLFSYRLSIVSSLIIALVILVLLSILTITSIDFIKKRMNAGRWKSIQRFSYVFFGLILFHLLGYLLIPALNGSIDALIKVGVYFVIFAVYLLLRLRRIRLDKLSASDRQEPASAES
jgi:DMSO/TMAO reductase YedYZ heme-binding membrane subunit